MRGIFVTGTGTEVGKSVVSASICAALAARGKKVAAYKPVVTGIADEGGDGWPPDHELLASVATAGQSPKDVAPIQFEPPVSPHHAAELAGKQIEPRDLVEGARKAGGALPLDDWLEEAEPAAAPGGLEPGPAA